VFAIPRATSLGAALALVLLGTGTGCASLRGASEPARATAAAQAAPRVRIETDSGAIVVELYPDRAPVTVANFMRYVGEGRYDGGAFYRAVTMRNQPTNPVRIEVIQGGVDADSSRMLPAIAHETTERTGLRHVDGAISMARSTPGSARSEFFICIGDQPELDFGGRRNPDGQGFAAFGRVVDGMDVVRRIQRMPSDTMPPQRMPTVVRLRRVAPVTR
jgi:peptidyl-prolyl cis-trans isomerase A (cyclophilin A)